MKTAGRLLAAALILGTCGHTASRAPVARRCAQIDRDNQQALAAFAQIGGKAVPEEFKRALHDAARCVETPHGAWGLAIGSLTVDARSWAPVPLTGLTLTAPTDVVALSDGRVAAHALLSHVELIAPGEAARPALALAPVAVAPELQLAMQVVERSHSNRGVDCVADCQKCREPWATGR